MELVVILAKTSSMLPLRALQTPSVFARDSSIPSLQTLLADILFSSSVDCGSTRNHTTGPSNFKRATSALGGLAPQELSVSQAMIGSECNTSMQVSQRSKGSCDVLKIPSNRRRSYVNQGTCLSNAVMEGIIPSSKFFIVLSRCDRITSRSWNGRDIRKVEHAGVWWALCRWGSTMQWRWQCFHYKKQLNLRSVCVR